MPRPKRRAKSRATQTSLALFGSKRRMEAPQDRQVLALALSTSDKPQMQAIAQEALMEPHGKPSSLARIAERHGVNLHMLSKEITELSRSEGLMRAAQRLPVIMEQVADDATGKDVKCKKCKGEGYITVKRNDVEERDPCENCDATGTVYQLGDVERLRMIFETFGLTGKGGGLSVNLDLRKVESHESMAELSASIAPLLEGGKP
jgi:hypothetical protein